MIQIVVAHGGATLERLQCIADGVALFHLFQRPGLLFPRQIFLGRLAVYRPVPHLLNGGLRGIEIPPFQLCLAARQSTELPTYVVQFGRWIGEITADDDIDLRRPPARIVERYRAVVISVRTERVVAVHPAEDFWCAAPPEERKGLIDGMGTGIEQSTSQVLLPGLPVPPPAEFTPGRPDVHDFSKHPGSDGLLHFLEKRLMPVVLKGRQHSFVSLCRSHHPVKIPHGACHRLFTQHMPARAECGQRGRNMQWTRQGVYEQVKVGLCNHPGPVVIRPGAEFPTCIAPPLGKLIGHGHDSVPGGILHEPFGVNVVTAAALSPYGHPDDVLIRHRMPFKHDNRRVGPL